jgi:hypothetical protein
MGRPDKDGGGFAPGLRLGSFRASGVVVGQKSRQQRLFFAPVGRKKGAGPKAGPKTAKIDKI